MSIVYGLNLVCDLLLYLAEIGMISLLMKTSSFLISFSFFISIGAGLGFYLSRHGEPWRYIPLLLALAALPFHPNTKELVLAVPIAVYSILYVVKNHTATDYYYAFQRFRVGVIILFSTLVLSLMLQSSSIQEALLAVALYLILSIALLRILRHDDKIIKQRKFQIINISGILGVCLVGGLLSIDAVVQAMLAALKFVYENIIMRILSAILWIIGKILELIVYLLSLLPFGGTITGVEFSEMIDLDSNQDLLEGLSSEEVASNPIVGMIFKGIGIILGCVVVFLILRALANQLGRMSSTDQKEERESLDETDPKKDRRPSIFRRRNDPVEGVRYVYRQYLKRVQERGIPLTGRQNSQQIRDLSAENFDETALDDLREVYIRARYGGESSAEDARQAKDAYNRLKKNK